MSFSIQIVFDLSGSRLSRTVCAQLLQAAESAEQRPHDDFALLQRFLSHSPVPFTFALNIIYAVIIPCQLFLYGREPVFDACKPLFYGLVQLLILLLLYRPG